MPPTLVLVPNWILRPSFGPDLAYCMSKNLWEKFKDEYSGYCPIYREVKPKIYSKADFFFAEVNEITWLTGLKLQFAKKGSRF